MTAKARDKGKKKWTQELANAAPEVTSMKGVIKKKKIMSTRGPL